MNSNPQTDTRYIACNLCEAVCGLEIRLENGGIKSIRGDGQDPLSKGHICPKAVAVAPRATKTLITPSANITLAATARSRTPVVTRASAEI